MGLFDIFGGLPIPPSTNKVPKVIIPKIKIKGCPLENVEDAINPISIVKRNILGLSLEEAKTKLNEGE